MDPTYQALRNALHSIGFNQLRRPIVRSNEVMAGTVKVPTIGPFHVLAYPLGKTKAGIELYHSVFLPATHRKEFQEKLYAISEDSIQMHLTSPSSQIAVLATVSTNGGKGYALERQFRCEIEKVIMFVRNRWLR